MRASRPCKVASATSTYSASGVYDTMLDYATGNSAASAYMGGSLRQVMVF